MKRPFRVAGHRQSDVVQRSEEHDLAFALGVEREAVLGDPVVAAAEALVQAGRSLLRVDVSPLVPPVKSELGPRHEFERAPSPREFRFPAVVPLVDPALPGEARERFRREEEVADLELVREEALGELVELPASVEGIERVVDPQGLCRRPLVDDLEVRLGEGVPLVEGVLAPVFPKLLAGESQVRQVRLFAAA